MKRQGAEWRPSAAGTATSEVIDDEVVVYCERTERMHCLDRRASVVWALCDGSRDLPAIVGEAAQVFNCNAHVIRPDVEATVEKFWKLGILA